MNLRRLTLCLFFLILVAGYHHNIMAQDWPALRGATGTGMLSPGGVLSKSSDFELKVRWKIKIGSGYSSVVVSKGRVIAMYTDGDKDVVGCFDAETGAKIWTHELGPKFVGKNGSFDGPLSTPIVHNDHVYVISALGMMYRLALQDGEPAWSRDLQKQDKAPLPMYGFTTSPLIANETLVVQVGGKNTSIAGFDLKTGERLWAIGDDPVSSQSPAVIDLKGKQVILACAGKNFIGIDSANGQQLFKFDHQGGNGSAVTPVQIGENEFLLTADDAWSKAVSLRGDGQTMTVSEEWQERSIKNTYNIPVHTDKGVFAFSTRILTCVDSKTGRAHWKTRKPGDGFLIVVDDHVIISTKKGSLHIAKANSEKYQELVSDQVFDDLVWSVPAYSDNSVFLRSLGELARVDIVPGGQKMTLDSKPMLRDLNADSLEAAGPMSTWLSKLADVESKEKQQELVNDFLEQHKSGPIIDGELVTFFYVGNENQLALASDIFGARQERAMIRFGESNLFFITLKLPTNVRANYVFLADYQPKLDPKNQRTITSSMYAGEMEFAVRVTDLPPLKMNWFAMEDWEKPAFIDVQEKLIGKIVSESFESELLKSKFEFDVYTPPRYEEDDQQSYPVVYVLGGPMAKRFGKLEFVADRLFSIDPNVSKAILVFVNSRGNGPDFDKAIGTELVPFVDKKYKTISDRTARSIIGNGFVATGALTLIASQEKVFGGVSIQSPLVFEQVRDMVLDATDKIKLPTTIYLDWGQFDMHNPHENWDIRKFSVIIQERLKTNQNLNILGGEVADSTDWSSWINRLDTVLNSIANANASLQEK